MLSRARWRSGVRRAPHPRPRPQERGLDRCALGGLVRVRGPGDPLTPALSPRRGGWTPSGVWCALEGHAACAGVEGGVGGSPPTWRLAPSRAAPRFLDPCGGVGAQPPQKENPRAGGWAEPPCEVSLASTTRPCACSSGMGVWGGGFTGRGDTPQGPRRRACACPRGPQYGYVLAASARRAIARGRPSKMRRWIGQSAYQ